MYSDPTQKRQHVVKVYLNDAELNLLRAARAYSGEQLSVFVRDLLMRELEATLETELETESKSAA